VAAAPIRWHRDQMVVERQCWNARADPRHGRRNSWSGCAWKAESGGTITRQLKRLAPRATGPRALHMAWGCRAVLKVFVALSMRA